MKESNLKNMVVLKNLPSNIMEEAIIILKENKEVKKLEKIDKSKKKEKVINDNQEDYILKEAEMIINNYISDIENKKKKVVSEQEKIKKYRYLKRYAFLQSIIVIVETVILFIK